MYWRNSADFLHFPIFSLTLSLALEFLSSDMTGNTLFSMIPKKSGYFPRDWKKQPILYLWSRATSSRDRAVSRRGTRSLSTHSSHLPLRLSSFTTWHSYLTLVLWSLRANCEKSFMWKLHEIHECFFHTNSREAQLHKKCLISFLGKQYLKALTVKYALHMQYYVWDFITVTLRGTSNWWCINYSERYSEVKIISL